MVELDYLFGWLVEVGHRRWFWDLQSFFAGLSLLPEHQDINEILDASDADAVERVILE